MRAEQKVNEMAQEALSRQAKAHAQLTAQPLDAARAAVLGTPAGRQLEELRSGAHQHEEARDWQENLLWERALERSEDMVTLDAVSRFATERHYSWLESYMEWLEGKEARAEYHAVLEEELTGLRG